jgi:hypothetical protein
VTEYVMYHGDQWLLINGTLAILGLEQGQVISDEMSVALTRLNIAIMEAKVIIQKEALRGKDI